MTENANPSTPDAAETGAAFVAPMKAPSMPDITDLVQGSQGRKEPRSGGMSLGRNAIAAVSVAGLVLLGGGFFAGKAMAAGPASLYDAMQQASSGELPCGAPPANADGGGGGISRLCGGGTPGGGTPGGGTPGGGAGGAGFPGGGFGRGLSGTVTAVTATTLTLETRAGSVAVALAADVAVAKTVAGAASDIVVGSTVQVASTTDASGNRTASRVTLVPADALPGGGPGGPADQSPAG